MRWIFGFAWYFLSLKGRISRQEFWLGQALLIVLVLLLEIKLTAYFLAMRQPESGVWSRDALELTLALPFYFISAVLFWPVTAIVVKRLHDLNLSGWWVAVSLALSLRVGGHQQLLADLPVHDRRDGGRSAAGNAGAEPLRRRPAGARAGLSCARRLSL